VTYAEDNKPLTWGNLHAFFNLLYGNCMFKTTAIWKHTGIVKKEGTLPGQGLPPGKYAEIVVVDT